MGRRTRKTPRQKRRLPISERPRKLTKKGKLKHKRGDLKMLTSRNVSFEVTCSAVYQSILDAHVTVDAGDPELRRHLGLDHFAYLATRLEFSLDDLSLYVLAHHLNCPTPRSYCIPESKFIAGLRAALVGTAARDVSASDGYRVAFAALRRATIATNRKIWNDESERERFYRFIHTWALRLMPRQDLVRCAVELWRMFFRTTRKAAADDTFTGYVYFARLPDWLRFVQSPAFCEHSYVSLDLWHQLLHFSQLAGYTGYSVNDAWPIAIDDFVTWLSTSGNGQSDNTDGDEASEYHVVKCAVRGCT